MAKDRAYKYGWHPDRPQDAQRHARSGDDVAAPEGSTDGWMTTRGFAEATRVTRPDVTRAVRTGVIRGAKHGGRWYIAPEEVEKWTTLTERLTSEIEAEGQAVAGFYLSIDEDLGNVGTADAPEYRKVGYQAYIRPIYDLFREPANDQPLGLPPPGEPRTLYVQYRGGLKFTSNRMLTDDELDLRVKHRRAALDRDRSHDKG